VNGRFLLLFKLQLLLQWQVDGNEKLVLLDIAFLVTLTDLFGLGTFSYLWKIGKNLS